MEQVKKHFSALVDETVVNVALNDYTVLNTLVCLNRESARSYLQVFNVAAADVVLGTTAPKVVIPLPASGGIALSFEKGWSLPGASISIAGTTDRGNDTGADIDVFITRY